MALYHDRRADRSPQQANLGWRKAIRYALTENPVVAAATPALAAAKQRRRARLPDRVASQGVLFEDTTDQPAARVVGQGIWEEA